LLSQLPFIELTAGTDLGPLEAALGALAPTTTKLRLAFLMDGCTNNTGSLGTVRDWLELLAAVPGVGTVQITFRDRKCNPVHLQGGFPVYRGAQIYSCLEPAVERVRTAAVNACEQEGRWVRPRVVRGWLRVDWEGIRDGKSEKRVGPCIIIIIIIIIRIRIITRHTQLKPRCCSVIKHVKLAPAYRQP
jgi:hypothetical protein